MRDISRFALLVLVGLIVAATSAPATAEEDEAFAHQTLTVRRDKVFVGEDKEKERLESPSAYCLDCHGQEEAVGTEGTASTTHPAATRAIGAAENSHPINVLYPLADASYVRLKDLDERLHLVDGRVTCITCHQIDEPSHALAFAEQKGRLCMACHLR